MILYTLLISVDVAKNVIFLKQCIDQHKFKPNNNSQQEVKPQKQNYIFIRTSFKSIICLYQYTFWQVWKFWNIITCLSLFSHHSGFVKMRQHSSTSFAVNFIHYYVKANVRLIKRSMLWLSECFANMQITYIYCQWLKKKSHHLPNTIGLLCCNPFTFKTNQAKRYHIMMLCHIIPTWLAGSLC